MTRARITDSWAVILRRILWRHSGLQSTPNKGWKGVETGSPWRRLEGSFPEAIALLVEMASDRPYRRWSQRSGKSNSAVPHPRHNWVQRQRTLLHLQDHGAGNGCLCSICFSVSFRLTLMLQVPYYLQFGFNGVYLVLFIYDKSTRPGRARLIESTSVDPHTDRQREAHGSSYSRLLMRQLSWTAPFVEMLPVDGISLCDSGIGDEPSRL